MVNYNDKNIIDKTIRINKLYSYMKKHPSVLISCFSALTIVVSVIFNGLLYINELKYFEYWSIDEHYINRISTENMYFLVIACIFYFVNVIVQQMLFDTYEKLSTIINIIVYTNHKIKFIKKEERKKVQNLEVKHKRSYVQEHNLKDDRLNNLKNIRNSMCKYLFEILRINMLLFGSILFLSAFLFLWITKINLEWKYILLGSFTNVGIGMLLPCVFVYIFQHKKKLRVIKEQRNEDDSILMELIKEVDTDFILIKIASIRIENFFTKEAIRILLFNIVMLLIYILVALYPIYQDMTIDKKTFNVITESSKQYVIIYKDGTEYYLEEAKIVENTININITRQRILKSDDISYETIRFKKVKKVDLEENINE